MTKSLRILLILILILAFSGVSYALGVRVGKKSVQAPIVGENTFQAGWEAAKKKLKESGLFPPEPEEIKTITGAITEIKDNSITIKADPVFRNPLEEQGPETRTVKITDKTKISKQESMTSEELEKKRGALEEALRKGDTSALSLIFKTSEIKFSDLKTGDRISVTAEENIKMAKEIVASEILLH